MADLPGNYAQALQSREKQQWQQAMADEIEALDTNGTFDLVPPPKNRQIVASGGGGGLGGGDGFMR